MVRPAVALALLALAASAWAQTPVKAPGYSCPDKCAQQANCHCASNGIPGGLSPSQTPQFVMWTNDDAVTVSTKPIVMNIADNFTNPNGCKVPVTWFVSINYTDYHYVQEAYMRGDEIATHTLNHVPNPGIMEIVGAKLWLNQTVGVPMEKIKGFRAPFLLHNNAQRTILQKNGFTYDSSVPEVYPTASSPDEDNKLWPYTMDYGLPQRCRTGTGGCSANESHPGLWQVPMWAYQNEYGEPMSVMDPPDVFEALKREFDRNYNGNRAPVPIFLHAAWLVDKTRAEGMKRFIQYALSHKDVHFATISQVLDWMENPVPASRVNLTSTCAPPTDMYFPSGKFCKKLTCVNGYWSDMHCTCICTAEWITRQPGFCRDEKGICRVAKKWDEPKRIFYCPTTSMVRATPPPDLEPPKNPNALSTTPECGHPMLSFGGLEMSGKGDNSARYATALRAVDGKCSTCASARDPTGNYFTIMLAAPMRITGVFLVTREKLSGAYLFVGNSSANNGLSNPVCAKNVTLADDTPSVVTCSGTGSYVTLATQGNLTLCDIYVVSPDPPPTIGVNTDPTYDPTTGTVEGKPADCDPEVSDCQAVDSTGVPYDPALRQSLDESASLMLSIQQGGSADPSVRRL